MWTGRAAEGGDLGGGGRFIETDEAEEEKIHSFGSQMRVFALSYATKFVKLLKSPGVAIVTAHEQETV